MKEFIKKIITNKFAVILIFIVFIAGGYFFPRIGFFTGARTSTVSGGSSGEISGWSLSTSTVVCMSPESCEFQADGTDDDVQIQAAIDSVASQGGGVVNIKNGQFNISSTIDFKGIEHGMMLKGSGWGTILYATTGLNSDVIKVNDQETTAIWAAFKDFKIDGNNTNQTGGDLIHVHYGKQCLFDNVWFHQPYDWALNFESEIIGANPASTYFGSGNRVSNCIFDNGHTSAGEGGGLKWRWHDENTAISSEFSFMGGSGKSYPQMGIVDLQGLSTISSCAFVHEYSGVRIQDAGDTKILGSTFDNLKGDNIFLKGNRLSVVNNHLFGIGKDSGGSASAIAIDFYGQEVIIGNTFSTDETDGVTSSIIAEGATSVHSGKNIITGNRVVLNGELGAATSTLTSTNDIVHSNIGFNDVTNGYIMAGNADNQISATSTIFIDPAGYVGIGTTDPQRQFHVSDSTGLYVSDTYPTPTKGFRARFGGGTDFEFAGGDAYFSVWANGDFSGAQRNKMLFEGGSDIVQAVATWQFRTNPHGEIRHIIDGQNDGVVTFNEDSDAGSDFRVESDNNTHMLFVDAGSDTVGVGVSSPASILHVYQNDAEIGGGGGITIEQDGAGDAQLQYLLTGTKRWVMGVDNSDSDIFKLSATEDLSSSALFELDSSGNLLVTGRVMEQGTYGGIHVHDGVTAQSLPTGTTYTKITQFADNNLSSNMVSDHTNDIVTATYAGVYQVNSSLNFQAGTNNVEFRCAVFVDGVEDDSVHFVRKVSTAGDVGSASLSGPVDMDADDDIDVRCRTDNGGSVNMTIEYGNFSLFYLGE